MRRITLTVIASAACLLSLSLPAQNAGNAGTARLVSKDNRVEVAKGSGGWASASAGQPLVSGDRVRTGEDSRASLRLSDGSVLQLDELTTVEIKPSSDASSSATLSVPQGAAFFFSRGASREVRVETPSANGAIRGTAFLLTVKAADGRTAVSMIEGAFELSNKDGRVTARQGEEARAGGEGPAKVRYGDTGATAPWYLVIENQLPSKQGLIKVSKAQFLKALPDAIKQFRQVASQLSGGATIARKEWARDILREAFKVVGSDCGMRGRILQSIIAADPEEAAAFTELAIGLGPECAGAFGGGGAPEKGSGNYGSPPTLDFGNPPGLNFGGGGQGNVVAICHNGRTIFVSPAGAEAHLRNHPGDTLGACQITPFQNR